MKLQDPSTKSFTKDERSLIAWYLYRGARRPHVVFEYGVYVLPSVLFAGYGLWASDLIAVFVAYLALLAVVLFYLSYQRSYARLFYSVLEKYEARVGVIKNKSPPV